jgi:hypothetical protein
MECRKIQEQLALYRDEILDKAELENIRTHLASCDECQLYLDQLNKISAELTALPEPQIPAEFLPVFRHALREEMRSDHNETMENDKNPVRPLFSGGWKKWSMVAAVFVVGIISIYGLQQNGDMLNPAGFPEDSTILSMEEEPEKHQEETGAPQSRAEGMVKDTEGVPVEGFEEQPGDVMAIAGMENEPEDWDGVKGTPEEENYYLEVLKRQDGRDFTIENSFKDEEGVWHFLVQYDEEALYYEGKDGEIWISESLQ